MFYSLRFFVTLNHLRCLFSLYFEQCFCISAIIISHFSFCIKRATSYSLSFIIWNSFMYFSFSYFYHGMSNTIQVCRGIHYFKPSRLVVCFQSFLWLNLVRFRLFYLFSWFLISPAMQDTYFCGHISILARLADVHHCYTQSQESVGLIFDLRLHNQFTSHVER